MGLSHLERAGVIVTQQGRGSFVSERVNVDDVRQEELERTIEQAARLGASMGMTHDDLVALLEQHTKTRKLPTHHSRPPIPTANPDKESP